MKLIEGIRRKLASIGGCLDPDCDYTLNCDAPKGYVWCANGTPTLSIHYANNSQSWLAEAVRSETPNLRMGLRLATADELPEIRWNNDDDAWGAPEGSPERLEWPK